MSIQLLTDAVIGRIAAGEVIERPASIVKETVENAIDAGATSIEIRIENGGIDLIEVSDNGCGIPHEEVELAFQRHATSKIRSFDDMQELDTLGFRGEALPSIAAVCDTEFCTRSKDEDVGTRLVINDGKLVLSERLSRQQGTTITATHLFAQVPVRLKFLSSPSTEASKVASIVTQYALSYPEIKFKFISNDKIALETTGNGSLQSALVSVYGIDTAEKFLTIDPFVSEDGTIAITGMVTSAAVSRATNKNISIFVNRRWTNMSRLVYAVELAYQGMLMTKRYPMAVINIQIDPELVDVNIHPSKNEVKFNDESRIFGLLTKTVKNTVTGESIPVSIAENPIPSFEEITDKTFDTPSSHPYTEHEFIQPKTIINPVSHQTEQKTAPIPMTQLLPILNVIGQYKTCYVVCEGPDGLYLIDQHAAHERVRFEQVIKEYEEHKASVQPLLNPEILDLTPQQSAILSTTISVFKEVGFDIESFGDSQYIVRSIPTILIDRDWRQVFKDILDRDGSNPREFLNHLLSTVACHSAVRFGQKLNMDEMKELIRLLEKVTIPHTCPHGRPLMLYISEQRLIREFGRTG